MGTRPDPYAKAFVQFRADQASHVPTNCGTPEAFSIELERAPERNEVLILGGSVSESNMKEPKVGTRSAVLLKQGEPDRMLLWFDDSPSAGDCDAFARNIPDEVLADENAFQPVEGDIQTG